jgi:hypothetical protein
MRSEDSVQAAAISDFKFAPLKTRHFHKSFVPATLKSSKNETILKIDGIVLRMRMRGS